MIGEVLGKYRVVSQIGAGGMGTVWLAEHEVLGSPAAIKVLLPELSVQPTIVQRFFDEARSATRIRDPGIVGVLDFGWDQGRAYLVMEYLVGQSLSARLREVDRLRPAPAARVVQQAALAMAAAHARGIIHRDLKPDNLYLVADAAVPGGERVKVLDFGIAKLLDRDTQPDQVRTRTDVIMGTPAYMSPEQCRAAAAVDHRTDIYALGCVLFHALCGRPPFIAPTQGDMIASHLREEPPPASRFAPELPAALDALVARCLAKDPGARPQTMAELARACAAISGDAIATEPPPPATPQRAEMALAETASDTTLGTGIAELSAAPSAPPPRRSRRAFAIALAVLAAGGVTAGAIVLSKRGSPATPAAVPRPIDAAPADARPGDSAPPSDAAPADAAPVRAHHSAAHSPSKHPDTGSGYDYR